MRLNLDRYVGRAVLGSFGAALLFFLVLTVILDLLNNLGSYLENVDKQGMSTLQLFWFLAGYYARLTPFSFVTLAPFATVIGCMFAVARMIGQNELQPMLFVGRSMRRVLRPALICGALCALAMGACWQWVVPRIAVQVTDAQNFLAGDRGIKNVVLEQRSSNGFVGLRVRHYDPDTQRLEGVIFVREGVVPGDALLVRAPAGSWDARVGDWRLEHGLVETGKLAKPKDYLGAPDWTPATILQRGQEDVPCDLLSYTELAEMRRLRPNRIDVAMALHRHITGPLANVILLLLALPFAVHFERGSRVERVLGAIAVCAAYLLFDLTCQNLGQSGWQNPVVMAWTPTILFGSLGVVLFGSMRT